MDVGFDGADEVTVGAGVDPDGIGEFAEKETCGSGFADADDFATAGNRQGGMDVPLDFYNTAHGIFGQLTAGVIGKGRSDEAAFLDFITKAILKGGAAGDLEKFVIRNLKKTDFVVQTHIKNLLNKRDKMFTIRNVVLLICHGMDIKRLTKSRFFNMLMNSLHMEPVTAL